ncbi:ATP-binding protein [Limnobacter sp. MED105]|uniref:ATP-binding protein n=1 Tax=Limnobacter sp. MED105 TaxID=391597 RepID=UPI000156CA75|nr:ATP-binding protein [Limnobacter sp. MED105]EDM83431.1 hypothetical protein LMED105_09052 [Limnobacter sp. MED105]
MNTTLELKFDPNTIEHLGVSLYSQLPSVLSELISNSWDADATTVKVDFLTLENRKEISIRDDGHGMTFEELNKNYLVIGRNRRLSGTPTTPKGRKPIGKKGLGKLSVFGICNSVVVRSVKFGKANQFILDLEKIKSSTHNSYHPTIIEKDIETTDPDGTQITLKDVRRKSSFNIEEMIISISKKFTVLDQFKLIFLENGSNPKQVLNEDKFKGMKSQFTWEFPSKEFGEDYSYFNSITGKIITSETPIKDTEMRGIYLASRGKIVNSASFFGLRDNDQFHNYITGYLHIDFIDDLDKDLISTDRHSLNWEYDVTKELQVYLKKVIRDIGSEWRKKRQKLKLDQIKLEKNLDIEKWQSSLPKYEKELSSQIINPILEDNNISSEGASSIIGGVIDKFNNETFKRYASDIANISRDEDIPKLLDLMNQWKSIETKQFKDLACSRVEVIKQFEEHIKNDTKEVPTLHNFLKKFSWLLDPRILEFRDEVTYSSLLKETFPNSELEEKNRRIDFLCSNALGEILYVIEIKKSKYKVDHKALEQAYEYGSFLTNKYASSTGFSKVVCFVVGGEKSDDYNFKSKERTYMNSGEVFVKTYRELLEQSKEYHKEFIDAYDMFNK